MRRRIKSMMWKHAWREVVLAAAVVCTGVPLSSQSSGQGAANEASKIPVFKSHVREVSIVFRVVDKDNQPVSGITRKITSFQANVGHAQVVILPDVSGSMSTVLEPLEGALYTFADIVSKDF